MDLENMLSDRRKDRQVLDKSTSMQCPHPTDVKRGRRLGR